MIVKYNYHSGNSNNNHSLIIVESNNQEIIWTPEVLSDHDRLVNTVVFNLG